MIGVDLGKSIFPRVGASMTGELQFRTKLKRPQFLKFMYENDPARFVWA